MIPEEKLKRLHYLLDNPPKNAKEKQELEELKEEYNEAERRMLRAKNETKKRLEEFKQKSPVNYGETFTTVDPLEVFDNHKQEEGEDKYIIPNNGVYHSLVLKGLPEDYKVFWNDFLIGERVYGNTYNLNEEKCRKMFGILSDKVVF